MGDKAIFMPQPTGRLLEFIAVKEPWSEYQLENGAIVRAKVVMTKVIDPGQKGDDGKPVYQLKWQHIVDLTWPEDLERQS